MILDIFAAGPMALMQAVSVSFVQHSKPQKAADCGHGSLGGLGRRTSCQAGCPILSPPYPVVLLDLYPFYKFVSLHTLRFVFVS